MLNLHSVSRLVQALADFFRNHYGTVLSTGAAAADGEIALAFVNIVRQQIDQQIGNAPDEFLRLRNRPDVFGYARIAAGERPELRHEVRVGQKAYIEDQVGLFRHTVAKAETHAGNQNTFLR